MASRNQITKDNLQRLAQLRADGPVVLSAYLDLDPEHFATAGARESEVRSLIDSGHRQIESLELDHEQRQQLRADLERVEGELGGDVPSGARARAVFCCSSIDLFETVSLPESVPSSISVDASPHIAPLAEIGPSAHWCVTLVNRRLARIMRGSQSRLFPVAELGDTVQGRRTGEQGWYEHDVEAHLRHTADVLLSQQRRRPFAGLLVAAPQELRGTFEGLLHSYVRQRLVGYLDLDVETATEDQTRAAAAEAIADHEQRQVAEKLGRLRAELGRGGKAVAGKDDVLASLEQRRVEALLFTEGGQIADDVLEGAVEAALAQDAEVVPVAGPELGPLGGIAAILRF